MASKIFVNLDTSRDNYSIAKCKQYDDLTLEANIFENGLPLDITNKEITIQALKEDNTYIIQNADINKESNKITADLVRNFSRVSGATKIEIVLIESGKKNTTFSFCLKVEQSVIDKAIESTNEITTLEELQEKLSQIELENANAASNIEELNDKNNIAETNITDLRSEITKATSNSNKLKAENDKATPHITNLGSENTNATSNIQNLQIKNDEATTNISSLQNEISIATTKINSLKAENDKVTPNITNLSSENAEAITNRTNLQTENTKAIPNIRNLSSENTKAETLIPDLVDKTTKGEKVKSDLADLINNGGIDVQSSPRNLLVGEKWQVSPIAYVTKQVISKYHVKYIIGADTVGCTWIGGNALRVNVKKDNYITFLAWVRSTIEFEFRVEPKNGTFGVSSVNRTFEPTNGEFVICKITTKALTDNPELLLYGFDTRNTNTNNGTIEIKEWALYNSQTEMDWIPAPEDIAFNGGTVSESITVSNKLTPEIGVLKEIGATSGANYNSIALSSSIARSGAEYPGVIARYKRNNGAVESCGVLFHRPNDMSINILPYKGTKTSMGLGDSSNTWNSLWLGKQTKNPSNWSNQLPNGYIEKGGTIKLRSNDIRPGLAYQNFTFLEAFPTGVLDLQVSYYIYSDYITSIGDTNFTISADRYGGQIIFIKNGEFPDELTLRWRALGY